MPAVHSGPSTGLAAELVLLAVLAGTVGLGAAGWVAGILCAVVTYATLVRALERHGVARLGPADRVTLGRAALVGGVAALTADSFAGPAPVAALVSISVVALGLDAVDGWVARRTRTASPLGARFDMEVDAFLILVLSVYLARAAGAWVLAIGAARYAFVVAGWLLPWLRRTVPPRYWRKVVAATAGIVLTVAAADVVPVGLTGVALAATLAMLAESFGRDIGWLWLQRAAEPPRTLEPVAPEGRVGDAASRTAGQRAGR